jgi:uncharacterized membrane protein YhaH (DUF805 family)
MSFGEAIRTVFGRYAEFTGRATRPEFWWWALFNRLVALLLPSLAVTVRRLRDSGYGWGHLFWLLVPIAGIFVLIAFLAQPTKPAEATPARRVCG